MHHSDRHHNSNRRYRYPRSVIRPHYGLDGLGFVFHDLHYLAVGILFEALWQRDKHEGKGVGLVPDLDMFHHGRYWNGMGLPAKRYDRGCMIYEHLRSNWACIYAEFV